MDIEDSSILLGSDQIFEVYEIASASNSAYKIIFKSGNSSLYKPASGEQPLWDFSAGTLMYRELVAYHLYSFLGVKVPATKIWENGPVGPGVIQDWVAVSDDEEDILKITLSDKDLGDEWLGSFVGIDQTGESVKLWHKDLPQLRRIAFADLIMNNADRKASHVLQSNSNFYAIDHGLCFHSEDKIRTIFWGWGDEMFSQQEMQLLSKLDSYLQNFQLLKYLNSEEVVSLRERVKYFQDLGRFSNVPNHRSALPWPIY